MNDNETSAFAKIESVLVANRGEIARRVFATCRERGIDTVAVYSDADANSAFVHEADSAVHLPGVHPGDTYLRGDLIIDAALRAGANAIHPGYGFLSENAEFAQAVGDAGLIWIGPNPDSIARMGSKVESKALMRAAGVPVLEQLDPATITEADLPVLVKASAGGGGRGMRVVHTIDQLEETIAAAAREAASAFGDPTVFCERYIPTGHHIEVQVFGDSQGTVWAIGERECSLQRRHQKVIEEAPSPLVTRHGESMREKLYAAARAAAAQIGYLGAGTVEFLADDSGEFFFLEMNTRLQVEHPVTECTSGLDLVAMQLDIASGRPLTGNAPRAVGHAIEVRLYAEDPASDWQPQSGTVREFKLPSANAEFTIVQPGAAGLRLDSGISAGEQISTFYDPMIAKVIGVGANRVQAAAVLADGLEEMRWDGPRTNTALLVHTLREPAFLEGDTTTAYFDEHPEVFAPAFDQRDVRVAAIAAAIASASAVAEGAVAGPNDVLVRTSKMGAVDHATPQDADAALALANAAAHPRPRIGGWRLFQAEWRQRSFEYDGVEHSIEYRSTRNGWEISAATLNNRLENPIDLSIVSADSNSVRVRVSGVEHKIAVARTARRVLVTTRKRTLTLIEAPRYLDPSAIAAPGSLLAPMPGAVIRVGAKLGDAVTAGQPIVWLEAMKMEHVIQAPSDGVLTELRAGVGDQVEFGAALAVIAEAAEPRDPALQITEGATS